ncbi:MAG TPA: 50S ribosomal protein L19, partial [Balneolaceae bacterium]|nr:50S ribosomal protein L19 [Balneolaceae bacterium]
QQFEGNVISRKGSGANKTFMVRKISAGNIGVERIFPLNSPFIAKIEVVKESSVRRSKLYYLRDRSGKSARLKEKDTQVPGAGETEVGTKASERESVKDEAKNEAIRTSPEEELEAEEVAKEANTADDSAGETTEHENPTIEPPLEEQEQKAEEEAASEANPNEEPESEKEKKATAEEE